MSKGKWLVCSKCGRKDVTDESVIPHHIGTKDTMRCEDCSLGKTNSYGNPVASLCRDCCPTGHRTRFNLE